MEDMDQADLAEFRPYRYQEEVFRRAQKGNIIAALSTGSGKTLISVLLIKWITSRLQYKKKPVIFLVPKVTLVDQQARYLEEKTGLKAARLYGSLELDLSDRESWTKRFTTHPVLVMTPQIFMNALTHSLWSLDRVSLLVVDECHHTRKNHPYNNILREYLHVAPSRRPKVFGMTASPIWDIKNPQLSLDTLEKNMDAKVIGVREHVDELAQNAPRPVEVIEKYPFSPERYDFPSPTIFDCLKIVEFSLWQALDIPWYNLEIRYYNTFASLGPYAASLFLFAEMLYLVGKVLDDHQTYVDSLMADNDGELPHGRATKSLPPEIDLVIDIISDFAPFFPESTTSYDLPQDIPLSWCSPKVKVLVDILLRYHTPDFQGIIFVEQRQIASALSKVLPRIPELQGRIRTAHLVGQGVGNDGVTKHSDRYLGDPVALFRTKAINLLIATSVAEEGLDFPACDLVVRFDPLLHMVGYVQSRGRARNKASTFVIMIQQDDVAQLERYRSLKEQEPIVNHVYQTRHGPEEIDEEELDGGEELDPQDLAERERYVVPSTGAILTYDNALTLLTHLCSLIPRDSFTQAHMPKYSGEYQVRLILPSALPLSRVHLTYQGPVKNSKKEAKRAAAFMAMKRLVSLKVFDDYLLPVEKSIEREIKAEDPALQRRKKHTVPALMIVTSRDPWYIGDRLWIHPIFVDGKLTAGLVTGTLLPAVTVGVHGRTFNIVSGRPLRLPPKLATDQLSDMHAYTKLGVWFTITARPVSLPLSAYLIPVDEFLDPDWNSVNKLVDKPRGNPDWKTITNDHCGKLVVLCRTRAGGVFLLQRFRHDLTPLSSPPPGTREATHPTYREHWLAKWSTKSKEAYVPSTGPLIEVIRLKRNSSGIYSLHGSQDADMTPPEEYMLPLEVCSWLDLPPSMYLVFEALPNLCRRVTDSYRADSARFELGLPPIKHDLLVEALTIPSAMLPHNNQRLETLGDAVLGLCTTVHLLNEYPNRHEGQLTALRRKYVNNNTLCRIAVQIGLDRFLINESHSVHTWRYVEPLEPLCDGDSSFALKRYAEREVPRRGLQDCMEAILGASFISGSIPLALHSGTALGLEFGGTIPWPMRYGTRPKLCDVSPLFAGIEESLGYKFQRNRLLLEALTHPSFSSNTSNYQRLEFLGDAILNLTVIDYLYKKFPDATSHQLAFPRTKSVCAQSFASIAVRKLGLHRLMLYNSMELSAAIDRYVPILQEATPSEIIHQGWKYDPPKALSDIFESIIGAVLIDSNYDYDKTAMVAEYVMKDILEILSPSLAKDPVSELCEWISGSGCRRNAEFRKMMKVQPTWEREGVAVVLHGMIIVGPIVSASLSVAKFMAAERALAILKKPESEKSLQRICNCQEQMQIDTSSESTPSPATTTVNDMTLDEEGSLSDMEDVEEIERELLGF